MPQIELNRNEQLYGPASACIDVLHSVNKDHVLRYLDGYGQSLLQETLSKQYNLPNERVVVSYGAEEILRHIFNTLNPEKESVLTHELYYPYYQKYLDTLGISLHRFALKEVGSEFVFDIDDCISKYKKILPKVLLITSPNNPTGTSITPDDLERILSNVHPSTLVILDEAYWGFDETYEEKRFLSLLEIFPNLLILRSFSKIYGLAGLRIGFALCSKNVRTMIRHEDYYLGMNRISEKVAIAALEAKEYYREIANKIISDRERLFTVINNLHHFKAYRSNANLLVMRVAMSHVKQFKEALETEPVVIGKFVTENLYRISIGLPEHTDHLIQILSLVDKE